MSPSPSLTDNDCFKVQVEETLTNTFVVMGKDGKELRLQGNELKVKQSPELKPDDIQCCYRMQAYHAAVRKAVAGIRKDSVVEYIDNGTCIRAKVKRIVRNMEVQTINYIVPKDKVIHQNTVFLSQRQIRRARRQNKIWGVGLMKPITTTVERSIVTPTQV